MDDSHLHTAAPNRRAEADESGLEIVPATGAATKTVGVYDRPEQATGISGMMIIAAVLVIAITLGIIFWLY